MRSVEEIGRVQSRFKQSGDPDEMRKHESTIIVDKQYEEGLFRIEDHRYIQVVFLFDRSSGYTLKGPRRYGDVKGVFASRSPRRPVPIGVTTVELLSRKGNELQVLGLDALDGTPVLDLKPYVAWVDEEGRRQTEEDFHRHTPRGELIPLIKNRNMKELLLLSGRLHGHFCPGVSLGVQAAVAGLHRLAEHRDVSVTALLAADGMEELLAIVETNNCFTDGIQVVSGCTFGNNSLLYFDFGKTAVTFTDRGGDGLRVSVKPGYQETINSTVPRFRELFETVVVQQNRDESSLEEFKKVSREASFAMLEVPAEEMFSFAAVKATIPDYAPIEESVTCSVCGESVMASRTTPRRPGEDSSPVCIPCARGEYFAVTGHGIIREKR